MAARSLLTFWTSAALVLANVFLVGTLGSPQVRTLHESLGSIPSVLGNWQGKDRSYSESVTAKLGFDDSLLRLYTRPDGRAAWLYVAYWGRQTDGISAHSPKLCYPGAGWLPVEQDAVTIPLTQTGRPTIQVSRMVFQKGNAKELVLYWYQTGQRVVTSEYFGKFFLIYDTLRNRRSDVTLVRLSTDAGNDTAAATMRLQDLVQQVVPHLEARLPR